MRVTELTDRTVAVVTYYGIKSTITGSSMTAHVCDINIVASLELE